MAIVGLPERRGEVMGTRCRTQAAVFYRAKGIHRVHPKRLTRDCQPRPETLPDPYRSIVGGALCRDPKWGQNSRGVKPLLQGEINDDLLKLASFSFDPLLVVCVFSVCCRLASGTVAPIARGRTSRGSRFLRARPGQTPASALHSDRLTVVAGSLEDLRGRGRLLRAS
jgi:hypothetical protein